MVLLEILKLPMVSNISYSEIFLSMQKEKMVI